MAGIEIDWLRLAWSPIPWWAAFILVMWAATIILNRRHPNA